MTPSFSLNSSRFWPGVCEGEGGDEGEREEVVLCSEVPFKKTHLKHKKLKRKMKIRHWIISFEVLGESRS